MSKDNELKYDFKSDVIADTDVDLNLDHSMIWKLMLTSSSLKHNWLLRAMSWDI